MMRFEFGKTMERLVEWIYVRFDFVFDAISFFVDAVISAFQHLMISPPAPVVIACLLLFTHWLYAGPERFFSYAALRRSWPMLCFSCVGSLLILSFGLWMEAMYTVALVISAAFLALLIGIPLGILNAKSNRLEQGIRPVLDFMQTMPPFVYLIPAIIFFGVGNVPGVVATVIFALPPAVRFTNLGIRSVSRSVVEATESFGATKWQLLWKVQIPLAKPTILAGINQVIMLSLSMVVIASMVGAKGLGEKVYQGITSLDLALGFEGGLGIVIVAILLDRLTQAAGNLKNNQGEKK